VGKHLYCTGTDCRYWFVFCITVDSKERNKDLSKWINSIWIRNVTSHRDSTLTYRYPPKYNSDMNICQTRLSGNIHVSAIPSKWSN
jgi:hypothetical protein